ncbi:MAG TPA: nucleotidyltransferase family protein [Lysobacter sp.]|nr:nucleotidyltransferase family protein [Lysobacter sp.]
MPVDEALILVGGLGTRLRGVVADVPKPLAPIDGRPFLAWVLDRLADAGLRRVVLAAGYRADLVEAAIGNRWQGLDIAHVREPEPLGTGGAVRHALSTLHGADGVHVLNGDTYLDYDPFALEAVTRALGARIGVALAHMDDVARYGAVRAEDGRIRGFEEKGGTGEGWINAGAYFLTRAALDALPSRATFSMETDVLLPAAHAGQLAALTDTDGFIDIGVPEDYARAQLRFGARA